MKITRITLGLLLAVTAAAPLHAQVSAFTYQGRLNLNGAPANGHYDFMFRLLNDPTNGAAAPVIPINLAVPVSDGLFTTGMDFGAENFDGANRWLEINVRTNGGGPFTTLSPRQLLTPAPYAIHSANAASATSVSGSVSAAQLAGTISPNNIGAGSITTAMLAAGAIGSDQLAAGAVTTSALADGVVTAANVTTVDNWFVQTISKPTPADDDRFGTFVAAVGTDRVLIGAYDDDTGATDAGVAYLFSANGVLLTTFTNPTPAGYDRFGAPVAALGTDRVLIGAPYDDTGGPRAGTVYLFSTNSVLLATFINPTPAAYDNFGAALAVVGTELVLIGSPYDNLGASGSGAAYLFGTNGTLINTFPNPTAASSDHFGSTVAEVGTDRVLIGAPGDSLGAVGAGVAYLFSTNGALLTTFTNPSPAVSEQFGYSVAAVGNDQVLIGAIGAIFGGAVYLFSTNGTLVTTFANPTPASADFFGSSVAVLGTDRVLINSPYEDTGATARGAAYLFSTNGGLLTTFISPTPQAGRFGYSIAAVGADQVLIGAYWGGAAYLFSTESYTPGLVAGGVSAGSITTASLEDGVVTRAKLDPTIGVWTRAGNDVFRPAGNVGIGTSSFSSNRLQVAGMVGATAFNTTSDRAAKQDFTAVDAQAVLAKVAALPITQWRFKEFPGALHLGPMAQDFRVSFGLGVDDKSIATVDADGVALAAIQGLNQKLEETRAENSELKKRLTELERVVQRLSAGAPVSDPAR